MLFEAHCRDWLQSLTMSLPESVRTKGLKDTPKRMAEAWQFWTSGYGWNPAILKTFDEGTSELDVSQDTSLPVPPGRFDEMILQSNIRFYSNCEHHLTPFFGVVHIGYIPMDYRYVVGLSKLARLVDMYARRLQIQERLTVEIADAINETIKPVGVGVVVKARHMCLESRGVQKPGTITTTSALRGSIYTNAQARSEFLSFANSHQWNGI